MVELAWRARPADAEIREVGALVAAATEADGTAPLSEHVLLHVRHGGDADAAHLLARAADGTLVGFAHLDLTDPVGGGAGELTVHPDHRRRGTGTLLVATLLERTAAAGAPHGDRLRLWAHGEHPGAVAIARHLGFSRARVLWQLRRSLLAPLGPVELPTGVRLRPFVVGADEAEFLRVNNAAFDWHPEQGGWDVAQVKLREAEPWFDPEGFLLAVDAADRLLGFHWTKVHGSGGADHPHEPIGEVYVLGVDPAARGMRLGAALTLAGLRHLRDLGLRQVMLYVEADNAVAVRVYRGLGFTHWDTDVSYVR
jgi:mycothiol synthase